MYRSQLKYMQKDFDNSFEFPSNVHVQLHYYFLFCQTFIKISKATIHFDHTFIQNSYLWGTGITQAQRRQILL